MSVLDIAVMLTNLRFQVTACPVIPGILRRVRKVCLVLDCHLGKVVYFKGISGYLSCAHGEYVLILVVNPFEIVRFCCGCPANCFKVASGASLRNSWPRPRLILRDHPSTGFS